MRLEIIKDSIDDNGRIHYAIRRKFFGFIPLYKIHFIFNTYPTFSRLVALILFMGNLVFTIIAIFAYLIDSPTHSILYYMLGSNIVTLFYYNYALRIQCSLSEAEEKIKEYFRKNGFKKDIVQIYNIKKNEITVEKRQE